MSTGLQFSLRPLLVAILAVAAFFGGIRFERERQRREDLLVEEMALDQQRAEMVKEMQAVQSRLLERNASYQKYLQSRRERQSDAQTLQPKLRVIPDVVWEDIPGRSP